MRKKNIFCLICFVMLLLVVPVRVVWAEDVGEGGNTTGNPGDGGDTNTEHEHKWQYVAVESEESKESTVEATCNVADCAYQQEGVMLSFVEDQENGYKVKGTFNGEGIDRLEEIGIEPLKEILYYKCDDNWNITEENGSQKKPTDIGKYCVKALFGKNNNVELKKNFEVKGQEHKHEWEYATEGNNVKATCNESCEYKEVTLSLIGNKEKGYEVEGKYKLGVQDETTIEKLENLKIKLGIESLNGIKYYKSGEEGDSGQSEMPKEPGYYYVKVVFGNNGAALRSEEFEIVCSHKGTIRINEKGATCEKTGYTGDIYCEDCGKTIEEGEEIPVNKNNHTYGKEVYEWEEDESAAKVVWTCQNNNNHIKEYSLILTATEIKKATCVSKGKIHYTASTEIDGQSYKDEKTIISSIDPDNHVGETKIANVKNATCTAAGYTGDEICLSCNNAKNRGLTIDAKGYKWDAGKVTTQSTDDAEGQFTYTCTNGCKHTKTEIIPRKSVPIELGKKAKIISNVSVCQKMTFAKASKYKKYLTFNTKTGEIKTKKYYKTKISKSIPVKVFVGGKEYTVNIKPKISAPKIKVTKKKIGNKGYKYTFKYNIKGADKIKVRMQKGGNKSINKEFDRDISRRKSGKNSYILYSKKTMKKLNNKITFKIIAYYGKNQSETLTITK